MAAIPILEEMNGSAAGAMIAGLAGIGAEPPSLAQLQLTGAGRRARSLAIYYASAGFDLVDELDHLSARSIEPNVFFNPRFLAPAMPRLEDREVRLAVIRDAEGNRNRLRMLLPFSIERAPVPLAAPIIRAWSSPYGPVGTPIIDADDPVAVVEDFIDMIARPHLKFPQVLVLPDMRLDGHVASVLRSVALQRNLYLVETSRVERAFLQSDLDGDAYLKQTLRSHHLREFRRLRRRLGELGKLEYSIARQPDDVRIGVEAFLSLEATGWKGRQRTAMVVDRFRAAFAREAAYGLAQRDMCRVHMLTLDGRIIACLIVFIENGCAYTWKTAFDETYSAFSPGTLLMIDVTGTHLDDPNIVMTDSCAIPDHPVMDRLWAERRAMGTLVIGLTAGADRAARQAASQLNLYTETRNMARLVRNRLHKLLRR